MQRVESAASVAEQMQLAQENQHFEKVCQTTLAENTKLLEVLRQKRERVSEISDKLKKCLPPDT